MYTTRILAEYVSGLDIEQLPVEVRDKTIASTLDFFAAAVAGLTLPSVAAARRAAGNLFGRGAAAVWFSGQSLSTAGAALCNAAAGSALDLDDGHRAARGHPGAAVIPTALAVAMETGASANNVLAAIVAGYEVGLRIAASRNPENTPSRQSGRWTGYSATATAGYLRRTPPNKLSHALAIAGVLAPNQEANGSSGYSRLSGNDVKEGIPWSVATGITALHLAESGYTGPEDLLDHASRFDSRAIIAGLGQRFEICHTYFKLYSCCRYIHPVIDAFDALKESHAFAAKDISSIDVHIFGWALQLGNRRRPDNLTDIQYSIPYCLALAAVVGSQALLPIHACALDNPDVIAFADKIALHADPELDKRFPSETLARVVVTTSRGRYESPVTTPRGEAVNPMSLTQIAEKFRKATCDLMRPSQQDDLIAAIVEGLADNRLDHLIRVLSTRLA